MKDYNEWISSLGIISKKSIIALGTMVLPENPVVVFDIDETLLDRYGYCIHPIAILWNYTVMIGILPIIITNRTGIPYVINYTRDQLFVAGIHGVRFMYFRNIKTCDPWRFKENSRKNIMDSGYTTVMSIGDMEWDIGLYGGIGVLLPKFTPLRVSSFSYDEQILDEETWEFPEALRLSSHILHPVWNPPPPPPLRPLRPPPPPLRPPPLSLD
jgi:hypothetical protein